MANGSASSRSIAELLLRKGGGPLASEKNKDLLTPLHLAADSGHVATDLLDLLLRYGANVNAVDGLGQTGELLHEDI